MLKNILKKIPGFRTGKWWKSIIASLGYLFVLLFMLNGGTARDKIINIIQLISLFGIPFILITNLGSIRNKLPLFKNERRRYVILGWCLSVILAFVLAGVVISTTDNLHSEQYKEQTRIRQAQQDEQAKAEADKIAADKALADAKAAENQKAADAKDIEEQKAAEAKAIEDKKIADAKAIADQKVAEAKAIEDQKAAEAKAIEDKKVAEDKAVADQKAAYDAWVQGQFSAWDGSNIYLVDLVKEHLNDPGSFKHVETSYANNGDHLTVKMTYRAKNGFGALILQNVTAISDYKTNTIKIISQND